MKDILGQLSLFDSKEVFKPKVKRKKKQDWIGNYHSVCGCLGARNECKEEREKHDYYATQPIAAEYLIEIENLNKNIWECACGEGHLAKVFIKNGFNVKATDLIYRGFGEGGRISYNKKSISVVILLQTRPIDMHKNLSNTLYR